MKKVYEVINQYLKNEKVVVIGCSGGPDSMCLMHLLMELRYENNFQIVCAHVNHNVREASKKEQEFVKKYCQDNNLTFETIILNETNQSEANLRQKRYDFYETILEKYQANYLLTAHHGDDLVETILMRLTRGSNIKGYAGFKLLSQYHQHKILRPLIYVTKEEILDYNIKYNIPYVTDESNSNLKYTRNRYRHQLLPFLKSENHDVHLKFIEFSQELSECEEIISQIITKDLQKNYQDGIYYLNDFYTYHKLVQRKILENYLHLLYQNQINLITKKHLQLIIDMINKNTNSQVYLPNNLILVKEYNQLKIAPSDNPKSEYQYELKDKVVLSNKYIIEIVDNCQLTDNYCTRIDSSEVALPLYVRTRKPNDKIAVKNMKGTKKLQDIFVDSKIPKTERVRQPIVVDANDNIIWLPGLKKSKFDKSKQEKYDIIIKYYFESTDKGDIYEEKQYN